MSEISLDATTLDEVCDAIGSYTTDIESAINDILHANAGQLMYQSINPLIHPSGRTFRGHTASATASDWPRYYEGNLEETIATKTKYNYLYFPDDGTETEHHAGNQQFMQRGAEQAAPKIVELLLQRVIQDWS